MAADRTLVRLAAVAAALLAGAAAAPAQAQDDDPYHPYVHSDLAFAAVEPGGSVEVNPRFLQEAALPADAAAVVVNFSGPIGDGLGADGAETEAGYDNCMRGRFDDPRGTACVITEFDDLPGQVFTLTGPVTYRVDAEAPGPFAVCDCAYSVSAMTAEDLRFEFGDLWWDPESPNLLGLAAAADWDGPGGGSARYSGDITVETTEHPYDLAVADVLVEGGEGDTVEAPVEAGNLGPADALRRHGSPGSYTVRGQLPAGLELVSLDSDSAWTCLDPADLGAEYERAAAEGTALDRFDFACFTGAIAAGETLPLDLAVRITDADAVTGGLVEVDAVRDGGEPPLLDADLDNNLAGFDVAATAPPKLPATGSPTAGGLGTAAAAIVLGAVLLALTRRRSRAGP